MHDARDRNQGIWIDKSDRLYVAAYSSVASLVVSFSGYFRKANGEVSEYSVAVNPTSDRAVTAKDIFFGEGFLLSCVAQLASGNANRGQCYVRAQIQRNTGTPAVKLHNVLGGYVTDDYSPSFPYGKIEGPLEGQGYVTRSAVSTAGGNGTTTFTVPTGARAKVCIAHAKVDCDETVANRIPYCSLKEDDVFTFFLTGTGAIVALGTLRTSWGIGIATSATSAFGFQGVSLPDVTAKGGATFIIGVVNGVAGDTATDISFTTEEWIEA